MPRAFCLAAAFVVAWASAISATTDAPVQLLVQGRSKHVIVLDAKASPSEKTAAQELQKYFKACTGVALPLLAAPLKSPAGDAPMIVLGCHAQARKLGVDADRRALGEQGYIFRTVAPHIIIAGTPEAGTLYGVHRFLEECLGVRWYAPGVTRTPRVENVTVSPTDRLVKPAFQFRQTSYAWPGKDAAFMARQADNAGGAGPDGAWGVQHAHDGRCHTYFRFIHPDREFDRHPEYFSCIGGERRRTETQLCLTNPDVLDIVTRRMLERMRRAPGARHHDFSQMDYYNYCECPACAAMNARYGTTGGTQFWFVNELARRTSKVFPDKLICTLAYTYTETPPRGMRMHSNVAIWLCHMYPSCDNHPIAACPLDAPFRRRAEQWSKLCGHLYIWHYCTNFAHYYTPFPNLRAMAADMRFYRDLGCEGIFLQAMGHSGGGGEFSLLRPYYGMKLLWDPDQDPDRLVEDFLRGYYGAAWKPIRDYTKLIHDKAADEDIHMHLYTNPAAGYLTDDVMARAEGCFDRAEELTAGDPALLERVRVCRMPLVYARAFPRNGYRIADGKLNWNGQMTSLMDTVAFLGRMQKHGFRTIREHEGDPKQLLMMQALFADSLHLQTIRNGHLRVAVSPELAGRALCIVDEKTGRCVTAYNVKRSLFFPFCGGLETRIGEVYWSHGWMEPQRVLEKTENAITTEGKTFDGWGLRRKLSLLTGRLALRVETTITNTGKQPREARLRTHLELNLGALKETHAAFTNLAGRKVAMNMDSIIAGMREGRHFYDQEAPRDAWVLSGSKGLRLTQTIDNDEVDFTWLYAYPSDLGQLEVEIWTKRRVLGPGEHFIYSETISVTPGFQGRDKR